MAIGMSAEEYLDKSETRLCNFKREWESYATEVDEKLMNIMVNSITPSFSGNSFGNQISMTMSFDHDTDALKDDLEDLVMQVRAKSVRKVDELKNQIIDIDKNLRAYIDEGVDADLFVQLVQNLNEWIDYIPELGLQIGETEVITIDVSDEIIEMQKKWEKISAEEVRKKRAAEYGVSPADLDKHKAYICAEARKTSAKTYEKMKEAEKAFAAIRGYLDSAELEKACATAAAELKAKEEESERKKAEGLKKAVEAHKKKVAEITKAKSDYIFAETDKLAQQYARALEVLKAEYAAACRKNKEAAERASEEIACLKRELEETSLFAFLKKRQIRAFIEAFSEKLGSLADERKKLDVDYDTAKAKEKAVYKAALQDMQKNADKKFKLPKDPRE